MLHGCFTSRVGQDGAWGGSGKEAEEEAPTPLPPEPCPTVSGTLALPGSPAVAPMEEHTRANEGWAVKGNPMFSMAKMMTSFFPSCLP